MGQDCPPKEKEMARVVEQAGKKKVTKSCGRYWNKHTESVKASKITAELLGAGDLGIDRRNGGGRAADESRTGINGSNISRWQGNTLSVDGDRYHY